MKKKKKQNKYLRQTGSNWLFLWFESHFLKCMTIAWSKLDINPREAQQSHWMYLRLKVKGFPSVQRDKMGGREGRRPRPKRTSALLPGAVPLLLDGEQR